MQATSRSRPRPSRACARCARRKLGCDKVRPRCGRCTRDQSACEYTSPNGPKSRSVTFIDETPNLHLNHAALSGRLQRIGEMLSSPQDDLVIAEGSSNTSNESDDADTTKQDAGHLFLGAQSKSQYLSPTFFATIREELSEIEALVRSQRRRPSRGVCASFTDQMNSRNLDADFTLKRSDSDPNYGDIFPPAAQHSSIGIDECGNSYDSTLKQIVTEMPSSEQQDTLIWAYMRGFHTINPLFSGVTFLQQVKEFRFRVESDASVVSGHFLALMNAILFSGAVVADRSRLTAAFPNVSRNALVIELYHLTIRAIRVSGFPHAPSIHSFTAFLITNTALLRDEDPLACCAFIGTAFRIAQMLGLHRDPSTFPHLSAADAQVRRQIWFSLIAVDAQIAFASGLPPLIECKDYNISPISEKSDFALQEGIDLVWSDDSVMGIFVAGKINFYRRASDFLHILHSNTIARQELHEILEITDSIQAETSLRTARISQLEQTLPETPDLYAQDEHSLHQAEFDPRLARFSKIVLSMLASKPYAIMYGPLRKHKLLGEVEGLLSRAFMNCRKYLLLFLFLTQRQSFQPWHWCWPGQHQPFHSIMALITHLDEFPTDSLAQETRKLVDLAFYMCRDDLYGGIVADDGGEVINRSLSDERRGPWRLIRSARDRVWERAGLDSNVLLCSPRVNDIRFDDIEMPIIFEPEIDVGKMGENEMQFFLDGAGDDWAFWDQLPNPAETLATPDGLLYGRPMV